MPFKSKSQQRYMFAAESRGDIPEGTAERWAKHTKNIKNLPEKKGNPDDKGLKARRAAYKRLYRTGMGQGT